MNDTCHTMSQGEILNADKTEYPLFHAVLYGDKVSTAKFSKRLSCIEFTYEHDTMKAIKKSVTKDPTLVLDGVIFLEGLVQAEIINNAFEERLEQNEDKYYPDNVLKEMRESK